MKMIRLYLVIVAILILSLSLMAFQVLEVDEGIMSFITMIVALLLGFFGTSPINWFKEKLGVEDAVAVILVWVIAAVVGLLAMLLAGYFSGFAFTWENVLAFAGVFFPAATIAYERLKKRNGYG